MLLVKSRAPRDRKSAEEVIIPTGVCGTPVLTTSTYIDGLKFCNLTSVLSSEKDGSS